VACLRGNGGSLKGFWSDLSVVSISDEDLWKLVEDIDRQCASDGIQPHVRSIEVPKRVCERLGLFFVIGAIETPELKRIFATHKSLYQHGDMGIGAIHTGIACHLDMFFRVDFPLIYGEVKINFLKLTNASQSQLSRIWLVEENGEAFLSNIIDVCDIGGTLAPNHGFDSPKFDSMRYLKMSAYHNQAFAATLTRAC
jgi:hypothetical protein